MLSIFSILFGVGLQVVTKFWTLVRLGRKFKNTGLDLDRKILQSAHVCHLRNAFAFRRSSFWSRLAAERTPIARVFHPDLFFLVHLGV